MKIIHTGSSVNQAKENPRNVWVARVSLTEENLKDVSDKIN